jgi:hypothetical protein
MIAGRSVRGRGVTVQQDVTISSRVVRRTLTVARGTSRDSEIRPDLGVQHMRPILNIHDLYIHDLTIR